MGKVKKVLTAEAVIALEEIRRDRRRRVLYVLDEISMWLATTLAVLLSDAMKDMAKRGWTSWDHLHLNVLTVLVASLVSIISYGALHTKFKYNDARKPPYLQRLSTSLLYGFGWQNLVGTLNGS